MSRRTARSRSSRPNEFRLAVEGFKAVRRRQELRVAPLTIISGVNSSGKSSFMQPFLMMKQTLDSAFDPGPLLLHGANFKATEFQQIFSRGKAKSDIEETFSVELRRGGVGRRVTFGRGPNSLKIVADVTSTPEGELSLAEVLKPNQKKKLIQQAQEQADRYMRTWPGPSDKASSWEPIVTRNRCFLEPTISLSMADEGGDYKMRLPFYLESSEERWVDFLRDIIHVPGLRGNPERAYQRTAVGRTYPGTFDTYVASVIADWSETKPTKLSTLAADLESLGLTWKVTTRRVDDASVELMVGRMPHAQQGGANDLVSIADVGFGVSQTLPVLVALHAARPGQVVYIEQPEIHLHPRAQLALADCLVAAAKRDVMVVAETHSSLLIRGIQTAVAKGAISNEDLSLNWFGRDPKDGSQDITVASVDKQGRFGDWPLDFDDISRDADWAYLDAVEESRDS